MRAFVLALALLVTLRAGANEDAGRTAEARQHFVEGAALVKAAQWSEALAAFERSLKLRPHPITLYNIGACERALGRYTRAREAFTSALGAGNVLPDSLSQEARTFLAELERLLVHVELSVNPPEAAVALDGRALAAALQRAGSWSLALDPGVHLFTLSRAGFADVVVNRSFAPGSKTALDLKLDRLPATLELSCNRPKAIVQVDGLDVGVAPVAVERPGGSYAITIRKGGFVPYHGKLNVQPGERARLNALLEEQKTPVYRRWWFWTVAAVVVAGAGVGSYFAARASQTPTIDGGGLGWAVKLR